MNWQPIKHGYIFERMIGFSLPIAEKIAIISYEGVHILPITNPDAVVHYPELAEGGDAYDWQQQQLKIDDRIFHMLGLHGSAPLLSSSTKEILAFGKDDSFNVQDAAGRKVFSHTFNDMSGDWRVVTFTPDDNYILLGLPYELEIFKRR